MASFVLGRIGQCGGARRWLGGATCWLTLCLAAIAGERPAEVMARRTDSSAEMGPRLALLVDSGVPGEATVGERLIEGPPKEFWRLVPWAELGSELQGLADGTVEFIETAVDEETSTSTRAVESDVDPAFALDAYQNAALGLNDATQAAEPSTAGTCGGMSEQGTWQLPKAVVAGRPWGSTPPWAEWEPLRGETAIQDAGVVEQSLASLVADPRHSIGRDEILRQARQASGLEDRPVHSAQVAIQALRADWSGWAEVLRRGWWAAWAHAGSRRQVAQLEGWSANELEIQPATIMPSASMAARAATAPPACSIPFRAVLDGPQRYLFVRAISLPLAPATECVAPLAMSAPRVDTPAAMETVESSSDALLPTAVKAQRAIEAITPAELVIHVLQEPVMSISPPEGEPFRVVAPMGDRHRAAAESLSALDGGTMTETPVDAGQLTQLMASDLALVFGDPAIEDFPEPCPPASTLAMGNSLLVAGRAIGAWLAPALEWTVLWGRQFEAREQELSLHWAEWWQAAEWVRHQVQRSADSPDWAGEAAQLSLPEAAAAPGAGL